MCTEENLQKFSSLCLEGKRSSTVRASGAPYLLGEPEDLEQRELSKCQEGAVKGVAVFEPPQRQGKGSWRAERPEQVGGTQQEPHEAEQCRVVQVGQPSLHAEMRSLGLAGHQLCRKGSAFPRIINMSSQCTFAAVKAHGAVLGSCSHSVECSVTVPVSSKEATPAKVSQSGHAVPEGSQETGKCGRGHQDGGEPVIQEEWLRELGSFWLGEEKVKEQGSEASGGGVVKTEAGTFEACPVTGVGLQPQLARGEF